MNYSPYSTVHREVTNAPNKRLKIFTWHIHGSYLYYLSQGGYDIFVPINELRTEGYYGLGKTFPFGSNVYEIPSEQVKNLEFDCILYQNNKNYFTDQYETLSIEQRQLPKIYLEHNPPIKHPTESKHIIEDPSITIVHVTHFNKLMWNHNSNVATLVIEHGVMPSETTFKGEIERGIVVINNLPECGRLLGLDLFLEVKKHIAIDLIGLGTEELGGREIPHPQLPEFISHYRFLFNPIRYASLSLAVLEAMMIGIPVVAMATNELSTVIRNGTNGYLHTDLKYLIQKMSKLLKDKNLASWMGIEGKLTVEERFDIKRFTGQWNDLFVSVIRENTFRPKPINVSK